MHDAERLDGFIDRFLPQVAADARAALAALRRLAPGAVELVYDNYNALAIGFGCGERQADMRFSIAVYPRWVSLFFAGSPHPPDPDGLIEGAGATMRHVKLRGGITIEDPRVAALVRDHLATHGWVVAGPGRIIVRSVSAKQRPRRP